jgi:hypothetical protein
LGVKMTRTTPSAEPLVLQLVGADASLAVAPMA